MKTEDIKKAMLAAGYDPDKPDGIEVRLDDNKDIVIPAHLRPHYNPPQYDPFKKKWHSDEKFDKKLADLKSRLNTTLNSRSVDLSDDDLDQVTLDLHHAMHFLDITPNAQPGSKGGRPRNTGANELAKEIKFICQKYNLPASGNWNGSLASEIFTMVEELADTHLRKRSITGNPARRLRQT